jgi:hypothetical protein
MKARVVALGTPLRLGGWRSRCARPSSRSSIRRRRTEKEKWPLGTATQGDRTGGIGYSGFRGNRRSSRPPFGYALLDPQAARELIDLAARALQDQ